MKTIHRYEASFRVAGENVDPDMLTQQVKITPDGTRRKGERRSKDTTWSDSMWEIRSGANNHVELSVQLDELISRVAPIVSKLRSAAGPDAELYFWCAHFTNANEGFCGGPILSAALLEKIGTLGIALHLQTYAGTDFQELETAE